MSQENKKRLWEQSVPRMKEVLTTTFRCPVDNELLFSVPKNITVPAEKIIVFCKGGHKVQVPKYDESQKIY